MFHGSIPQDMRAILHEIVAGWPVADVYVGCSGNFTVERVLAELGRFALHGNDVTLYSSAIGAFFAGQPLTISLGETVREAFDWLTPYLADPADAVAAVMLATRFTSFLDAKGCLKSNDYYRRMMDGLRRQWPELHRATADKVRGCPLKLASYCNGDVMAWLPTVPREAGFISYPPFFGAAKAYERDFRKLDLLFAWDKPAFAPLDDAQLQAFFEMTTDRDCWAFGSNRPLEAYAAYLRGMTKTTNRGVPIYVYAARGPVRIVTPRQDTVPVATPRLSPGMSIGEKMTLAPLSNGQFQALRSQYMNVYIRPGSASLGVGVLVDGALVGVYAFSAAPTKSNLPNLSYVYLLSDFPVAPTDYPRLSKLVLYAALSKESQLLAERLCRHRVRQLLTTAFSAKPASMKYRGLFDVYNRHENPTATAAWGKDIDPSTNPYYAQRWEINYIAPIGQWTLEQGLAQWKQKHGKKGKGDGVTE